MDNFGDLIYLVLIVIAGIGGLLKNINKKKPQNTQPDSEPETDFGDIFKEIFEKHTSPEVIIPEKKIATQPEFKETYQKSDADYSQEKLISYETTTNTAKLRAKKELTKPVFAKKPEEHPESTDNECLIKLDNINDVRAAFIASEIFNRKY